MQRFFKSILHPPNRVIQVVRYLMLGVVGFILLTFVFRTPLASWYLNKRIGRFNQQNGAILAVSHVRIQGLSSILVTGITLKPEQGDTLLKIDSAYASVGILKLLAGRITLHHVRLINTMVSFESHDSITNFRFLLHHRKNPEDTVSAPVSYASAVDRMMGFIFDKIPLSLEVRNFSLTSVSEQHRMGFHVDQVILRDHYFRSVALVTEDSVGEKWVMAGKIDNHNRMAEFRLYSADQAKVTIPFIGYKWEARVDFDTLAFSAAAHEGGGEMTQITGFAAVSGLRVDHRKIAAGPVTFDKLSINYLLNIGRDQVELDSTSRITFNRIDFHPYLSYRVRPGKQVTFRITKPQFPAQDLFSSFPPGLFTNLDGLRVKGNLSWYLNFSVDLAHPDSLHFETSLDRHQFSVQSYGNADLTKINEPFS